MGNPIPPALIQDPTAPTTRVRQYPQGAGLALYGATSGYNGFKPASVAGSLLWELPVNDGSANQALVTNGSGVLSFATLTTAPGGSSGELQYNNAGAFGGAAGLAWTPAASPNLTVTAQNAAHVPLCVKMVSGQSANPFELRNNLNALRMYIDNTGAVVTTGTMTATGNITTGGLTISSGYMLRSTSGTSLYLVGSSGGVELGAYGTALATVKPNSANGTTSLRYHLSSGTALGETSAGVAEINNGTTGTYADLRAKELRAYETAGVKYASLTHDGTNANAVASSGQFGVYRSASLCLQTNNANGINIYNRLQLMDSGSSLYGFFDAGATNTFKLGSGVMIGHASTSTAGGTVDVAYGRNAAGVLEINNGTAGTLRDVKARTYYSEAQATTDTLACLKGNASYTGKFLEMQNSAGTPLLITKPLGSSVCQYMKAGGPGLGPNISDIASGNGAGFYVNGDTSGFICGGGLIWVMSYADLDGSAYNATITMGTSPVRGKNGSGTNAAGTSLSLAGGRGTGTGAGGSVKLQVAPAGSSGSSLNALVDALVLDSNIVAFITNRNAAPAVDPVGGGYLYCESGALKYRGSAGTVTTIAAA